MNGGSGYDRVYFTSSGNWTVNLSSGSASNGDETDVVQGMEAVQTGKGDDHVTGNGGNNFLSTGSGNDTLSGGFGDDEYLAGNGDDELVVLHGDNILNGGNGFDIARYLVLGDVIVDLDAGGFQSTSSLTLDALIGIEGVISSLGDDSLYGSNEANLLSSGTGDDVLDGRGGNDTILAGGGDDSVQGGSGNDSINAGSGSDTIYGGLGDDMIHGGDGNDALSGGWGNDTVSGDAGRDFITGNAGNDLLLGGDNDDQLRGGDGNDRLIGGNDNDELLGEAGNDVFRFDFADGKDTIRDWNTGDNTIEIETILPFGFRDLDIQQVGGDTVIEFGETQVTLMNVWATSLTKADFDFV
jgi:Ca2+-binding RTX toxin-like protein